jgi:hypothetical protein
LKCEKEETYDKEAHLTEINTIPVELHNTFDLRDAE